MVLPATLAPWVHGVTIQACQSTMCTPRPTPDQALLAAKTLAVSRVLGMHPRCMPDLRLLMLEPLDALEIVAEATLAMVVKSEPDDRGRPFWALELSVPHVNSPTGLLYVKPVLRLPNLSTGYILSFKASNDRHAA